MIRITDKSQRATVEQALDPRTLVVLQKWLNNGLFDSIHGCISTGKEANVYYARKNEVLPSEHEEASPAMDLAVKVYKTSILVFKDRDRLVTITWKIRERNVTG